MAWKIVGSNEDGTWYFARRSSWSSDRKDATLFNSEDVARRTASRLKREQMSEPREDQLFNIRAVAASPEDVQSGINKRRGHYSKKKIENRRRKETETYGSRLNRSSALNRGRYAKKRHKRDPSNGNVPTELKRLSKKYDLPNSVDVLADMLERRQSPTFEQVAAAHRALDRLANEGVNRKEGSRYVGILRHDYEEVMTLRRKLDRMMDRL